jgi:diadenosine tetraphosphate (Ap4A) HIT family hydrolase
MGTTIRGVDAAAPLASASSQVNAQQILDGWRASSFDAGVTILARQQLQPEYDQAIEANAERAGRELTDDEVDLVVEKVDDKLLDGARDQVFNQLKSDPNAKTRIFNDAVADLKARAPKLRNPFLPIAAGDPKARAKETMLWENPQLMVLVDRFAPVPHVLVIPKTPALLPTDLPASALDELGRVGKVASDVFTKMTGSKPSELFVNPPQLVTIGQLHLHVIPGLRPLKEGAETKFWHRFSAELDKALGPSA